MISKYFLIAFVCITLAQAQKEDDAEKSITNGLIRVEALYNRGISRINSIRFKNELIPSKALAYVKRIRVARENSDLRLRSAAQSSEEKAKELKRPEFALTCINKAEKSARGQIQAVSAKAEQNINNLEKSYLNRIQIACKPLTAKEDEFSARYDRTVADIEVCESVKDVEVIVNSYAVYVERFFRSIDLISQETAVVLGNFQKISRTAFTNADKEISRIQFVGLRQIKECVYGKLQQVR